jgi:hypothetical protein
MDEETGWDINRAIVTGYMGYSHRVTTPRIAAAA